MAARWEERGNAQIASLDCSGRDERRPRLGRKLITKDIEVSFYPF
jgi:hypothetical protein